MMNKRRIFRNRVLATTLRIPKGATLTYKEVARRAGNMRAARAVGAILHANHDPKVPCHRVIASNGSLGGYNRGKALKRQLLINEHIILPSS
jgi:O-6-methylguanine DNA methyltransferase